MRYYTSAEPTPKPVSALDHEHTRMIIRGEQTLCRDRSGWMSENRFAGRGALFPLKDFPNRGGTLAFDACN